jgi:hypothetical protein
MQCCQVFANGQVSGVDLAVAADKTSPSLEDCCGLLGVARLHETWHKEGDGVMSAWIRRWGLEASRLQQVGGGLGGYLARLLVEAAVAVEPRQMSHENIKFCI